MQPIDFDEIWQVFLAMIPNLVLAFALMLIGWLVGRLLYSLTWRALDRFRFDAAARRAGVVDGLEQAGFEQTPSRMMASLIFWVTLLSFTLLALETLGLDSILLPLQAVIAYLPRIIAAGIVLIVGLLLAQLARRAIQATLISLGIDLHEAGGRLTHGLIVITTVLIAIDQLQLEIGLLSDTFMGLVLVIAGGFTLAFALGAQNVARNILAGYYARDNLQAGDRVIINEREGILEAIGPIFSEISQGDDILLIPNQHLQEQEILVKSQANRTVE